MLLHPSSQVAHLPPSPRSRKSLPARLSAEGTLCPAGEGKTRRVGHGSPRVLALEGESNNVTPRHFLKPFNHILPVG